MKRVKSFTSALEGVQENIRPKGELAPAKGSAPPPLAKYAPPQLSLPPDVMRGVDGQLMIVFIIIGSIVIVILFVRPHHSQDRLNSTCGGGGH